MSNPLVQIQIRGGNVSIINAKVYAALIPPPNATTWVASSGPDGTIVFADQASGLVLSAPSSDPGTQAVAAPSGAVPIASWNVVQFSDDDGDDATPVKDPGGLVSGYYTLQDPASGAYLYRNAIEDRSLMPKFVGFPAYPGDELFELVIQVVSDGDDD